MKSHAGRNIADSTNTARRESTPTSDSSVPLDAFSITDELSAMRRLQEISTRLMPEGDIDALYQQIVNVAADLMRSDFASMQMLHAERGELHLIASKGLDAPGIAYWEWVRAGCGSTCGEALRTGNRAIASDVETCAFIASTPTLEVFRQAGIRAAQSTPLVSRSGHMLGMISTHWRQPRELSEHDLRLLDVLARQAADLIERAQAEARLRESEARATRVLESITDALLVVDADWRISYLNAACHRHMSERQLNPDDLLGKHFWDEAFPDTRGTRVEMEYKLAMSERTAVEFDYFHELWQRWYSIRVYPVEEGGIAIYFQDTTERKRAAQELAHGARQKDALYQLADRLHRTETFADVYEAALQAIVNALQCDRASILLYDDTGVMRFVGWHRLSERYRKAVEGHTPWSTDERHPQPVCVEDVNAADIGEALRAVVNAEGIGGLAFIPLVSNGRLIGKFMAYFDTPHRFSDDELGLCLTIARQLAFAIDRKRAEDALKEADRRKDEFLATLAHELRNPLAPLLNGLHIMKLTRHDADMERLRSMMERQLGHMVRLIDDLLDVSRISRGKIELRKERVTLAAVLQQAVETNRPLIEATGQTLTIEMPEESITIDADVARLAQVVGNLLNNASKFTPARGRISVSAERDGSEAVIRVRDTGVGIAPEQFGRIFDMFIQIDTSLERAQNGLGIGLTLVKTLTELHGGTVVVRSRGLGYGSEFVVRLPLATEQPLAAPREPALSEPATTAGLRILVVDDNADSADSLAALLAIAGHTAHVAKDGLQAIEAAGELRPDLVLLDIGLPKLNGYEVARWIREQPWGRDVVLMALTGWGQDNDRQKSKDFGFDNHLVKPIDYEALMTLVAGFHPSRTAEAPATEQVSDKAISLPG